MPAKSGCSYSYQHYSDLYIFFLKTVDEPGELLLRAVCFKIGHKKKGQPQFQNSITNTGTEAGLFPEVIVLALQKPESPSICENWGQDQEFSYSDVLTLYSFWVLKWFTFFPIKHICIFKSSYCLITAPSFFTFFLFFFMYVCIPDSLEITLSVSVITGVCQQHDRTCLFT